MDKIFKFIKKYFKCLFYSNMGRIAMSFVWILTFLMLTNIYDNNVIFIMSVVGFIPLTAFIVLGLMNGWLENKGEETKN